MKKAMLLTTVAALLLSLIAVPMVMAAGPNGPAGKSDVGHVCIVAKDPVTWEVLEDRGKLTYKISDDILDVVLNAQELVPGNWYLVEVVDKSTGWNPISPDNYSSFYAQANGGGNIHADFSCSVESGMDVEVNVKNAENVALLEPSAYGVPEEWILGTGQGWDYVLYSEALIAIP